MASPEDASTAPSGGRETTNPADAPAEKTGFLSGLAAAAKRLLGAATPPPEAAPPEAAPPGKTPPEFDEGALDREALEDEHTTLEGVKMGDLLRCRIQYLAAQNRSLNMQAQVADAKAATLLTVIGLLMVNGPFAADYRDTGDVVALMILALSALCFGACIYALVPRYPDPATRDRIALRDRFSWPGLASDRLHPEVYAQFVRDSQATHLLLSMARSNGALSKIILQKYMSIRFAFFCGVVAFFTFGFDFLMSAPPPAVTDSTG